MKFSKEAKSGGMINSETGKGSLSYIMALDLVSLRHLATGTGRLTQVKCSEIKFGVGGNYQVTFKNSEKFIFLLVYSMARLLKRATSFCTTR